MNMQNREPLSFYHEGSRNLQDRMDSRRIADRLYETRRKDHFTEVERSIIEGASMFFLATADAEGRPDCSVKGGNPGFVRVIDRNALVFPDYDGNGMFRSLGNISVNPSVALLFLELGGEGRKLRVNGVASITPVSDSSVMLGAKLLVRVTALDVFPNCPRYLPHMDMVAPSAYNPRQEYVPPEPFWKSKPDLKEFLPGVRKETTEAASQ